MVFACVMAMVGLEIIVESIRKLVSKVRYVQDNLVVFLLSFLGTIPVSKTHACIELFIYFLIIYLFN
jgi:divalent metal cation (Fe/Co/Zn/Cd) transporter